MRSLGILSSGALNSAGGVQGTMEAMRAPLTCLVLMHALSGAACHKLPELPAFPARNVQCDWPSDRSEIPGPPDLSSAARLYIACADPQELKRIKALSEHAFVRDARQDDRSASADRWIERKVLLAEHMRALGFWGDHEHAGLFRSAIWHEVHGIAFDVDSRARCKRAFDLVVRRITRPCEPGPWPLVPFACHHDGAIELGRVHWEQFERVAPATIELTSSCG